MKALSVADATKVLLLISVGVLVLWLAFMVNQPPPWGQINICRMPEARASLPDWECPDTGPGYVY